jgi:hypothetical protein
VTPSNSHIIIAVPRAALRACRFARY